MTDEVVLKSGYSLPVGAERYEIRDDGRPVHYVDLITEGRHGRGIICLSFATAITDADNKSVAQIAARLRMNLNTAQFLHKVLGDMITNEIKPVEKSNETKPVEKSKSN